MCYNSLFRIKFYISISKSFEIIKKRKIILFILIFLIILSSNNVYLIGNQNRIFVIRNIQSTEFTADYQAINSSIFNNHQTMGYNNIFENQKFHSLNTRTISSPNFGKLNTFNGHYYLLSNDYANWNDSKESCEQIGMHLVTITSAEENNFVENISMQLTIWLGLSDANSEGNWYWITGEPLNYTHWNTGEPNNAYEGEDYGEMVNEGYWNDIDIRAPAQEDPNRSINLFNYVCESEFEIDSNLILYLSMNENTGAIAHDISNHNYDAMLNGPNWTNGVSGSGLEFNGQTDYAIINPPFNTGTQEISVSVWVNYNSIPSGWSNAIISQDTGDIRVFQLSTLDQRIDWHRLGNGDDVLGSNFLHTNVWYHIVACFNGTYHRLFINGQLQDEKIGDYSPNELARIDIGRLDHGPQDFRDLFFFNGKMDEIRIYNRSINQNEITFLYKYIREFSNDVDKDGMDDNWEINHGLDISIDDSLEDLDGDGMPNLFEYLYGLNPNVNDALDDKDKDGLTNLLEFTIGSSPDNYDTDNDGIPDGYEYQNGLLILTRDAWEDKDNDGLPNIVEFNFSLNASNPLDAYEDLDSDGMPNLWEYQNGLQMNLDDAMKDLDRDKMPNLWEFQMGLDPQLDDSKMDKDGDFVTNYIEFKSGTKANDFWSFPILYFYFPFIISPFLLIFVPLVFTGAASGILAKRYRETRLMRKLGAPDYLTALNMIKGNFLDYETYRNATEMGIFSLEEYEFSKEISSKLDKDDE